MTPPAPDDAVALRVAIARIHRALRVDPERHVTLSQASALSRVDQYGELRLGALAQLEGVAPATMSKVVDALGAQGLTERVIDDQDKRASLVRVTRHGADTLHALRSAGTRAIREALATLNASEQTRLRQALPVLERLAETLHARAEELVR